MSFDLDACLDEYSVPGSKERAVTYTTQYPPSRMGLTIIPSFDSTEVSNVSSLTTFRNTEKEVDENTTRSGVYF